MAHKHNMGRGQIHATCTWKDTPKALNHRATVGSSYCSERIRSSGRECTESTLFSRCPTLTSTCTTPDEYLVYILAHLTQATSVTLAAYTNWFFVPQVRFLSLGWRERGRQVLVWSYSCKSLCRTAFACAEVVPALVHLLLVRVCAPIVFLHKATQSSWIAPKSMI